MNKEINQQLEDASARIESMLHIGGMVTNIYTIPEALRDMLRDQEDLAQVIPGVPPEVIEEIDRDDFDAFSEWAIDNDKLGFLVQFATPVMKHHTTGRTYSWGHYGTRWVYGETLEEAVKTGLEWVAERRIKEQSYGG